MRRRLLRKIFPKNDFGDLAYATCVFVMKHGRLPEKPPSRFNDHLYTIRKKGDLCDPLVQFCTDKELVKKHITSTVGCEYVVPTFDILQNKTELLEYFPDKTPCVFKPTQSSGQVVVCKQKLSTFERRTMLKWFGLNHYLVSRENNYRNLAKKIIVEKFISTDGKSVPHDYKVYCFHGIPRVIHVDAGRFSEHTRNFYDTSWQRLAIEHSKYPNSVDDNPFPLSLLDQMLSVAEKLAKPFRFVRVDFYLTDRVYVGELTFLPDAGFEPLKPMTAEYLLGSYFEDYGENVERV